MDEEEIQPQSYQSVNNFLTFKLVEEEVRRTVDVSRPATTISVPQGNVSKKENKINISELAYVITEEQLELEELRCGICLRLPNEAVVTDGCGHLFCEPCLMEAFSKNQMCPYCGAITSHYFSDKRAQRRIAKL